MKYLIILLTLITVMGCSNNPIMVMIPVSFDEAIEFRIDRWSIGDADVWSFGNDYFMASGREMGNWETDHYVFKCRWQKEYTVGGSSGFIAALDGMPPPNHHDAIGTILIERVSPDGERTIIVDDNLKKGSAYRPIVEALAGKYPR